MGKLHKSYVTKAAAHFRETRARVVRCGCLERIRAGMSADGDDVVLAGGHKETGHAKCVACSSVSSAQSVDRTAQGGVMMSPV